MHLQSSQVQCSCYTVKGLQYSCYCRCFTFGIGSGASTALVEGLARAGNGTAEFIKGDERMQPKVCMCVLNEGSNFTLCLFLLGYQKPKESSSTSSDRCERGVQSSR